MLNAAQQSAKGSTKVLFVHPSHPSQFTQIAYELAGRRGWEVSCLVSEPFTESVRRDDPPVPFYGFREDGEGGQSPYYVQSVEKGARCGKGVLEAVYHLVKQGAVEAVVGHACFGATLFLKPLLDVAVISYVELPGYHALYSRPEFPVHYHQAMLDSSLRALIHASVLQSDLSVVPSAHARSLFPPELRPRVRVQPEGFHVTSPPEDKAALRRDLGLPGDAPIIGFAARSLEAVRGFDTFVRAARRIHKEVPEVQFLVVGDEQTLYGNETVHLGGRTFRDFVWQQAQVNGERFTLKPFMDYLPFVRHLQAMDVALFPIYEGAANWGLFEAMAAGVPVLASNRCFIPEVVRNGENGLLFDPADDAGFAAAAVRLLRSPTEAARLSATARATILTRFSVARAASGYARIIQEALRRHRRSRLARIHHHVPCEAP